MATVRLNPLTGLPITRIVSSSTGVRGVGGQNGLRTGDLGTPTGPRSAPQLPYDEFGDNSSAPKFPGYGGPLPSSSTSTDTSGDGSGDGSGSGGSAPPDYAALVAADPGLQALRAELAAGNISAAQFRTAAIQRAIIAYGAAPDESALDANTRGYYTQDVTQLTKDLAAKNTAEGLSTRAQEDRAHQIALQGLQNALAARGMLQSGGLGVGLGLEAQSDKATRSKDVAQLIDYLSGQAQAYAEHLHQSKLQEAQAIMDTTQAYMQAYAGGLGTGGSGSGGSGGGGMTGQSAWDKAISDNTPRSKSGKPMVFKGLNNNGMAALGDGQYGRPSDGRYYILVQFADPDGGSNTIWIPVPAVGPGTNNSAAPPKPPASNPPAPTPTPTPTPTPAPVPPPVTAVAPGTIRPGAGF